MEDMWSPWLAGRVCRVCVEIDGYVEDLLAEYDSPAQWVTCMAEVLSDCAGMYDEDWPTEDAQLIAYLEREGDEIDPIFDVTGIVLVRGFDGGLCLTVGRGMVAEPFGGGFTINRTPDDGRYSRAFELPVTVYPGED